MSRELYNFCGIFLCCVLLSCGSKFKSSDEFLLNSPVIAKRILVNEDSVIVCDLSLAKDTITIYLDDFAGSPELILLESESESALVKADGHSIISENNIGIYSTQAGGYKLFNKRGEFISSISSRGNGPDEYLFSIYDSFIDEKEREVYLLPMVSNHILVYDFHGNFKRIIPLAYKVHKGKFKIDTTTGYISIGVLPFKDSPFVYWLQDMNGKKIKGVSADHLTITPTDYSNEIDINLNTNNFDLALFHWVPSNDTLYHYVEVGNKLKPVFTATFKAEDMLQHEYIELPDHFLIRLYEPNSSDASIVMVDKKNLKGNYVKFCLKALGGVEISSNNINFKNNFYWTNLYSFELLKECERILSTQKGLDPKIKEKLFYLLDRLDDESNNIIITGRLTKNGANSDKSILITEAKESISSSQKVVEDTVKNALKNKTVKVDKSIIDSQEGNSDNRIYRFKDLKEIKHTAILDKAKEYFRQKNIYKDWDPKDKKETRLSFIVEKNGTTSSVEVIQSSGVEKLDREAIRLIEEAHFLHGTNLKNEPIRCGDMEIIVYFPPK